MLARAYEKQLGDPPLPVPSEVDGLLTKRLTFVLSVEARINVGCHYLFDDLSQVLWNELVMLSEERNLIDRIVARRQAKTADKERGMAAARSKAGIPGPGRSLF